MIFFLYYEVNRDSTIWAKHWEVDGRDNETSKVKERENRTVGGREGNPGESSEVLC